MKITAFFERITIVFFYLAVTLAPVSLHAGYFQRLDDHVTADDKRYTLDTQIRARIHDDIASIKDALLFLLSRTEYQLAQYAVDSEMNILLHQPIAESFRNIEPMSLYEALVYVTGNQYTLVVDKAGKEITLVLRDKTDPRRTKEALQRHQNALNALTVKPLTK